MDDPVAISGRCRRPRRGIHHGGTENTEQRKSFEESEKGRDSGLFSVLSMTLRASVVNPAFLPEVPP
jgi:hypothetical protein